MSTQRPSPGTAGLTREPLRLFALIVGIVFLLVGVLGFIPGVTTNFGEMQFAGHESEALLLGLFQVSVLHNLVHLVFGVAGVAMARTVGAAKIFLFAGGAIYLVLWLYGLLIDLDSPANFVPFNEPVNWLHLFLGLGMIALGLIGTQMKGARR